LFTVTGSLSIIRVALILIFVFVFVFVFVLVSEAIIIYFPNTATASAIIRLNRSFSIAGMALSEGIVLMRVKSGAAAIWAFDFNRAATTVANRANFSHFVVSQKNMGGFKPPPPELHQSKSTQIRVRGHTLRSAERMARGIAVMVRCRQVSEQAKRA
jgi:hypothetical protein